MTQAQVAAKAVSFRYLGEIERGQRNPSVETIFVLARILGVTPAYLLDVEPEATARAHAKMASATIEAPRRGRKPSRARRARVAR